MKKPQLVKRLLAGSLVLALTVLDAVPATAAEMQQPEQVIETENAKVSGDLQTEMPETETEVPESETEAEMPETAADVCSSDLQRQKQTL